MFDINAIRGLRSRFRGELITKEDGARYESTRELFNAMFDRRPALILQPLDAADVATAIGFARETGAPLAVRCGGHSVAGYSSVDNGLVIDMRAMNRVTVDVGARRARAQGGANWGEFDRETTKYGLATTGGRVTTTGIAGLTLGSGSGWLDRLRGFTCDNLISAEVVTADGRSVRASREENSDLHWGLCGGGGNFGIVTEFEYQLHPIEPLVFGGMIVHRRENAAELLRLYRDFMDAAPRELSGGVVFITAPPAPFIPPDLQGKPAVAVIVTWFGDIASGERALKPLREFGEPVADLIQPMPYVALQSMLDAGNEWGRRQYWRSENLTEFSDAAIERLVAQANLATSPFTQIIVVPLGGAVAEVPEGGTPLGGRSARWQYHCYGGWADDNDAKHIEWVRETERALKPYTAGHISLNFVSEASNDRVRAAFGEATYQRLVALKDQYDPTNLFRLNQNVLPSTR
ncbi:MAG TPA: FAD-binding oxidoreductase [Polyangiales bacterium]|nr:FAD-binding oxidoreductase [Polyangiales bacterium]